MDKKRDNKIERVKELR